MSFTDAPLGPCSSTRSQAASRTRRRVSAESSVLDTCQSEAYPFDTCKRRFAMCRPSTLIVRGGGTLIDGPTGAAGAAGRARPRASRGCWRRAGSARGDVLALWAPNIPPWAGVALGALPRGGAVTGIHPPRRPRGGARSWRAPRRVGRRHASRRSPRGRRRGATCSRSGRTCSRTTRCRSRPPIRTRSRCCCISSGTTGVPHPRPADAIATSSRGDAPGRARARPHAATT